MSKSTNNKSQSNRTWNNSAEFADVRIWGETKDAFSLWLSKNAPDTAEALTVLTDDSYRVSLKYDYNNTCYACSLTQQDAKHHNNNLVIISRAGTADEAVLMSVYKVMVMFPGERLPTQGENDLSYG